MAVVLQVEDVDAETAPKRLKNPARCSPGAGTADPGPAHAGPFPEGPDVLHLVRGGQGGYPVRGSVPGCGGGRQAGGAKPAQSLHRTGVHPGGGVTPETQARAAAEKRRWKLCARGPSSAHQLDEVGISKATLDTLCEKGVLTVAEQDKTLDLFADIPFAPQPITLAEEQQRAYDALVPDLEDGKPPCGTSARRYGKRKNRRIPQTD